MWRKPTEDDLVATLQRKEVTSYRRDFETDPVPALISDTVAWARGFIRSNGNVQMDPDELTLPASCISAAMDCVAFKLLKRFDKEPNETRREAWRNAVEFFAKISKGEINPESFNEPSEKPTGGSCAVVIQNARPRVSSGKLEGL